MSGMEHGSVPACCPLSAFLVCWPMAASRGPHHSRWGLWVSIRVWAHLKPGACAQGMPRAAALAPDPVTASCTPRGERKVFCAGRGKRKVFCRWRLAWSIPLCAGPAGLRAPYQLDAPAAAIAAFVFQLGGEWKPGVSFLYKQEGFIIQGPSSLNGIK